MKKILSLIIVFCILLMPFKIYADTPTYFTIPSSTTFFYMTYNNQDYYIRNEKDTRSIIIKSGIYYTLYVISNSTFQYMYGMRNIGVVPDWSDNFNLTASSRTYAGVTYYYVIPGDSQNKTNASIYNSDIPVVNKSDYNTQGMNELDVAYKLTYGDWAVEPEPVQTYGLLNIRFNTDISTYDAGENQDNILWSAWDSNGNYIGDKKIEIRAVPGYYEAQDKPSLLQLKFINWVRESNLEVQVFKGSVIPERKTYTWNYIAGLFSSIKTWQGRFWSIFASDEYWYQYGWIYEARILDTDDTPLSEWQEIVTGTSSSPKDTEIIETSDELTPELYNVIYNINVYNDHQENWQINNTTINMQPEEELDNDKPWWVVLLEGILSILDKLLDMLLKLFVPEDFSIPEFTTNSNQYMQNTGIFGQAVQFVNDTGTSLQTVQNADPVISIPAISWQNTTIIPAQSWNLNTLVNDYGLSDLHNMVYLVTDGFIYIGLIIMIRRKVIEALKK